MTKWTTYRGMRWRIERKPFGPDYNRRQPYLVKVEGTRKVANASNPTDARQAAERIIDREITDEEAAIVQQEADEHTRRLNTDWSQFPLPPEGDT